jgi:isoleucyl-tRNA synthetase
VIDPVDSLGNFSSEVSDFAGRNVHEANSDIIRFLKKNDAVLSDETYEHNYPHCWRCRTALIYKAIDAWYFNVEKIKSDLLKTNQEISWHPETVKDGRFGKWLENARDWNISRNRFWATPIPVWECSTCDDRDVFGSIKEIEDKANCKITDLHKEFLDEISYSCSCGGTKKHAPEVLDGWFESGSMPYGQYHYPFENAEHFRTHFPSDFIVEYTGQIRGWFYVLHVLSTALFQRPAFKDCMVHGTLLAADGKKISKSLKNYTDPLELIDLHGADAFRAYLLSSNAVVMADLSFRDDGVENMIKSLMLPYWNALSFFTTYAEIDEIDVELVANTNANKLSEIDSYILGECEVLVQKVTEALNSFEVHEGMRLFPQFFEVLNNWYIRRSRERVWAEEKHSDDKLSFYSTVYRVLSRVTLILAPFCPFISEAVWKRLGKSESVHLATWPEYDSRFVNTILIEEISFVRAIISAGLFIRAREKVRVRQPLATLKIAYSKSFPFDKFIDLIKDELNVKHVIVFEDASKLAKKVAKANAKLLGPRFGKDVQTIIKNLKEGLFTQKEDGTVEVAGFTLRAEEIEIAFAPHDGLFVEPIEGGVVALDLAITPELELEGAARDLVRTIQDLRKEADLNISDRIRLSIEGCEELIVHHGDYIKNETLCIELVESVKNSLIERKLLVLEKQVTIALFKV